MKMHVIKTDVFRYEVGVLIGKNDEAVKCLRRYSNRAADMLAENHDVRGLCITTDGPTFIWVGKKDPDIVAHEAVHAAFSILTAKGIPIDKESDELIAHIVEYIVDKTMKMR